MEKQWRSKEGQVGTGALGRSLWGRINTLYPAFKTAFLSRN